MKTLILGAALAALLLGCASAPQRNESLEEARAEFQKLSQDPLAQQAATADMDAARRNLQQADTALQQHQLARMMPPEYCHRVYEIPHAGTSAAGVGFSATKFITDHWLFNVDAALNQIRGSPAHSPVVERRTQRVLALSVNYHW